MEVPCLALKMKLFRNTESHGFGSDYRGVCLDWSCSAHISSRHLILSRSWVYSYMTYSPHHKLNSQLHKPVHSEPI